MSEGLYELFASRFPHDRSRPFLETPEGDSLSYGELEARAARVAGLLGRCGVRVGDRVAVQVEKSPDAVALYLGCLRAGAVFLPLNTAYVPAEVEYFLNDAEPALVVCRPEREEALRPLAMKARAREVLSLDQQGRGTLADALAACDPASEGARLAANDPAAILYTSGTTGRSKGAVLTQRNLAANALALHEAWGFGPDDVLLHILPIYHAHGLFVALHTSLLNGTRMRFHRRFDPVAVVRDLARSTVLMGVPTHYSRLLAEPTFTREACASMRLFVSGSAPLLEETFHAFRERSGHTLLERYGMTETGMNASNPLSGERVAGSVGPPLSGVEARVVADDGTPLPDGEVGSLEVRGENVFREYWRMPEKTQSEFRSDGFFITGDLARIDERGYLQLVGRAKDLVITGGLNVYPREVEEVIDALPGVVESAVFGVPHADLGEGLTAVVVPQDAANPPAEDEIRAAVRGQRAAFKVPKRVLIAAALPRNAMGKVLKSELRERHAALYSD